MASNGPSSLAQELTEEQKQEIKEAFDLFDTDGSGAAAWRWRPHGDGGVSLGVSITLIGVDP